MAVDVSSALPIVFIPALLCDEAMFRGLIAELGPSQRTQVIVADRRTVAESVAEILARAPERFVLVGASYGGIIAMEVALAAPQRIAGLCLSGADPSAPDAAASEGFAAMLEGSTAAAVDHLATAVVRPDATAARQTFREMAARIGGATGGAGIRALSHRASAWERLGELTMPALVVWGAEDALFPVDVGRRLAAALPNGRLEVVDGSGHLPMLEAPQAVGRLLATWLSDDVRTSGGALPA